MDYKKSAEIFKALSHPTRLKILELLKSHNDLCVCHIYEALELEQANVSQHLRILRTAGLIKSQKLGLKVHYSICCNKITSILDSVEDINA